MLLKRTYRGTPDPRFSFENLPDFEVSRIISVG